MSDEEFITRFFDERAVHTDQETGTKWYGTLKDAIESAAHKKHTEPGESGESGARTYHVREIHVRVHHSPSHIEGWMAVVDPTG